MLKSRNFCENVVAVKLWSGRVTAIASRPVAHLTETVKSKELKRASPTGF